MSTTKCAVVSVPVGIVLALGACDPSPDAYVVAAEHQTAATATAGELRQDAADVEFLMSMIPHHEVGITMSRSAERRAGRGAVRDLAEQIVAAQSHEVALMRAWLRAWGEREPRARAMTGMPGGGMHVGMARGRTDRMFLVMMIAHHEDAIVLANDEIERGRHRGVRALAQRIVTDQTAQIAQMKQMLAGLEG